MRWKGGWIGRQRLFDEQDHATASPPSSIGPVTGVPSGTRLGALLGRLRTKRAHAGEVGPATAGTRPADTALDGEDAVREQIAALFPTASEYESSALLRRLMLVERGHGAPCGSALTAAHMLAGATQGDAPRALAVASAWLRGAAPAGGTPGADMLAFECALARSGPGWTYALARPEVLAGMSPDGHLAPVLSGRGQADPRHILDASDRLLKQYVEPLHLPRPETLDAVIALAHGIASGVADPRLHDMAPEMRTYIEYVADALLGAIAAEPTPRQCEALVFLRGGQLSPELIARSRSRFHRLVAASGGDVSFAERVRSSGDAYPLEKQRVVDLLSLDVVASLRRRLDAQCAAPFDATQGLPPAGDTHLHHQFERRVEAAARRATLVVTGECMEKKGGRAPMRMGSLARGKIRDETARSLGMSPDALSREPAFAAFIAQRAMLDVPTLERWARAAVPEFDGSALAARVALLDDVERGRVAPSAGLAKMAELAARGADVDLLSMPVAGVAEAARRDAGAGLRTLLGAAMSAFSWRSDSMRVAGRSTGIAMTGRSDAQGARVALRLGTFARDRRVPARMTAATHDAFAGLVVSIEAEGPDGAAQCERIAGALFGAIEDARGEGGDTWQRFMRVAAAHPCVAMRFEERSAGERPDTERRAGIDAAPLPLRQFPGLTVPFGKARLGDETDIVVQQQMTPEVKAQRAVLETLALHVQRRTDDPSLLGAIAERMDALTRDDASWRDAGASIEQTDRARRVSGRPRRAGSGRIVETRSITRREALDAADPAGRFPPTPRMLYPGLFEAVQMSGIFQDSKTFVDMVPRGELTPAQIMADYHAQREAPDFDLRTFVETHFEIVEVAGTDYEPDPSMPILDHIDRMWDVLTLLPSAVLRHWTSLLTMKHPHVVPSPRFSEAYYWDTYFTVRGLLKAARDMKKAGNIERANVLTDLAAGMVQNIADQIDRYGFPPNGGRTYYRGRSQLPFFSMMVRELNAVDPSASARYLPQMMKEDAFWDDGLDTLEPGQAYRHVIKLQDGTVMYRHWSDDDEPREESFDKDVATGDKAAAQGKDPKRVYRELHGGAETGQDYAPARWSEDGESLETLRVTDMASVSLTALRAACIQHMADTAAALGDRAAAQALRHRAKALGKGIRRHMWDPDQKVFTDYLWREGQRTGVVHSQSMYVLFANAAGRRRARANLATVERELVNEHGLATTAVGNPEEQWDLALWAPEQIIGVLGASNYMLPGSRRAARRFVRKVATGFTGTVERNYLQTGVIEEKFTRDGGISEAGEYSGLAAEAQADAGTTGPSPDRQTGFAWTNSAYVELKDLAHGPVRPGGGQTGAAHAAGGKKLRDRPRPYGRRFG